MRGLKPDYKKTVPSNPVAPHAGAWIETVLQACIDEIASVAPHAGAWIETLCNAYILLKQVAPHAGAWIETLLVVGCWLVVGSHPTRVRGLKL